MSIYNQLSLNEIVNEVFYLEKWIQNQDLIALDEDGFLSHAPNPDTFLKVKNSFLKVVHLENFKSKLALTPQVIETIKLILFRAELAPSAGWKVSSKRIRDFFWYDNPELKYVVQIKTLPELYNRAIETIKECIRDIKDNEQARSDVQPFYKYASAYDIERKIYDSLDLETLISFTRVSKRYKASAGRYITETFHKYFPIDGCQTIPEFYKLKRMVLFTVGISDSTLVKLIQAPAPFKALCVAMLPHCRQFIAKDKHCFCLVKPSRKVVINNQIKEYPIKNADLPEDHPINLLHIFSNDERSYDPADGEVFASTSFRFIAEL